DQYVNPQGSLEWTLGEIMTETYTKDNGFLTQGFRQPSLVVLTPVIAEEEKSIIIYPNPVRTVLNVRAPDINDWRVELINLQGQRLIDVVDKAETTEEDLQLDVREIPVGVYLVRVTNPANGKSVVHRIHKY